MPGLEDQSRLSKGGSNYSCPWQPEQKASEYSGEEVRLRIRALARSTSQRFNHQHLTEKLNEKEGIRVSRFTVRSILPGDGLANPDRDGNTDIAVNGLPGSLLAGIPLSGVRFKLNQIIHDRELSVNNFQWWNPDKLEKLH